MFPQGLVFQETCRELSKLGGKVHGIAADVSGKEGREAEPRRVGCGLGAGWVRDGCPKNAM